MPIKIPDWAERLIDLYESETANQFILYGNVNDRFVLPSGDACKLGDLYDFLRDILMPRFDVLLSYDLGNGIRVERGGELLSRWAGFKESPELPRAPRQAIEFLTRYFRYSANLARLGQPAPRVGFVMKAAHLVAPALPGALNYDLNALASFAPPARHLARCRQSQRPSSSAGEQRPHGSDADSSTLDR